MTAEARKEAASKAAKAESGSVATVRTRIPIWRRQLGLAEAAAAGFLALPPLVGKLSTEK
jgi:hypothetical protein